MALSVFFRKDILRIFLLSLLPLFLLPGLSLLFVHHAEPRISADYLTDILDRVEADAALTPQDKQANRQFFTANPPASTCDSDAPALAAYRAAVCSPYSGLWQFHLAGKVAAGTLLAGALVMLATLALAVVAFWNRRARHASFVAGWRLLALASAVEVVVQGALLVWLSFWGTAYFWQVYSLKIVAVCGILVALAGFHVIRGIFRRPPLDNELEGEAVAEADAPTLWARIRALAAQLGTTPPDHIVAGIDNNFFVTESPLTVAGQALRGRLLFVSIPLLRLLDQAEADAVLAHELAHLRGGDTASSARLGPRLARYDHYCAMMGEATLTRPVFHLLQMYRVVFEIALQKDSREREFQADRLAARQVSPQAIVQSLLKISAYSAYRGQIEQQLFARDEPPGGAPGIARYVADGLAPYARSADFLDAMRASGVPHPFDSHPPLAERMANVGHFIGEERYGDVATQPPAASWADAIHSAAGIEQRLWARYEAQFQAAHEQDLAYRYVPADEAEAALVLKYFPPEAFALKGGREVRVAYTGLTPPAAAEIAWDQVSDLRYEEGFLGDVLTITHPGKGWRGARTTKVKLPGLKDQRPRFSAVLEAYWQRHQIMRSYQSRTAAETP